MTKERFKLIGAVYVLLRNGDKLLLARRANTGFRDGEYGLVSGHMDGDELATSAMVREAREEAGIEIDPRDLRLVHTLHRLCRGDAGSERIELFFECDTWRGDITNMEPEKCDDMAWFAVDALPDNVIPYLRNVIVDAGDGIIFSEYETEPI